MRVSLIRCSLLLTTTNILAFLRPNVYLFSLRLKEISKGFLKEIEVKIIGEKRATFRPSLGHYIMTEVRSKRRAFLPIIVNLNLLK